MGEAGVPSPPGRIRLGTQGWNYPGWVGPLYPEATRPRDFLKLYARAFDTVEIDSTFYAIPPSSSVRGWLERTPDRFVFSLKLPQEITHQRRLAGAESVLDEFLDRARELGSRLGPVLVQLGPDFSPAERPALERFLGALPGDVRFAVEFRQRAWLTEDILESLASHRVALAITDGPWMPRERALELLRYPTADFLYLRWMGENRDIVDYSHLQIDRDEQLRDWAEGLSETALRGLNAYGYVNNHYSGHSPATVRALLRLLGEEPVAPAEIADQISLF